LLHCGGIVEGSIRAASLEVDFIREIPVRRM